MGDTFTRSEIAPDATALFKDALHRAAALGKSRYTLYPERRISRFAPEFMPPFMADYMGRLQESQGELQGLQRQADALFAAPAGETAAQKESRLAALGRANARIAELNRTIPMMQQATQAAEYSPEYRAAYEQSEQLRAAAEAPGATPEQKTAYLNSIEALKAQAGHSVSSITREGVRGYVPFIDRAKELLERGTREFPEEQARYMNPYQQAVFDRIGTEGGRFLTEKIMPALTSKFIRAGQHGGGKHGRAMQLAARDLMGEVADKQAQAMQQGYQQAGQLFNTDQARAMQAAREQGNLATTQQGGRLADITALRDLAAARQGQEQLGLDTQRNDFLDQREYPWQQLSRQVSISQGIPLPTSQTQGGMAPPTTSLNMPGALGQLAGHLFGAQAAQALSRKRGGSVRFNPAHINLYRKR